MEILDDGLVGPSTYRRMLTSDEEDVEQDEVQESEQNFIVYNGERIPIDWPKVVLWDEPGGLPAKNYRNRMHKPKRDIKMFVNHWDATLSAKHCHRVLSARKPALSVHFLLDNDGTLYQCTDLQNVTFHCKGLNDCSVGIEISCAYYTKYQSWYRRHNFGERPVWRGKVRGKLLKPHLGFYDVQIQAAQALWKAMSHPSIGIPLQCPMKDGEMDTYPVKEVINKSYRGVIHHFHASKRKIDCAGFDLHEYLEELT